MKSSQLLKQKQLQLKKKQQLNSRCIEQIKQLKNQVQNLRWKIPEKGIQQDIEQLKQSIKIPSFLKKQSQKPIDKLLQQFQVKISDEADKNYIKYLEGRRQMLYKLDKLKSESNLYSSHKRVILKQYLQGLREKVRIQKQVNQKLQLQKCDLQTLKKQHQELQKEINKTSEELSFNSTINAKIFTKSRSFF